MTIIEKSLKFFINGTDTPYLKLKGDSDANTVTTSEKDRYDEAKTPTKGKTWTYLNEKELKAWIKENGWGGLPIPPPYILLDIDSNQDGELVYKRLKATGVKFMAIKTPNGYQFLFKDTGRVKSQVTKYITISGIVCDYRISGKGYTVAPSENIPDREFIHCDDEIDPLPLMFTPVRTFKPEKDTDILPLPIYEGNRDDQLFRHAARIREWNRIHKLSLSDSDVLQVMEEINNIFCEPPLSYNELRKVFNSSENYKDTQEKTQGKNEKVNPVNEVNNIDKKIIQIIPFPFDIFPEKFRTIINAVSESFSVQPSLIASIMLSIISGAIGNTLRVSVKRSYEVILFIWLMVIGKTGYCKTPPMDFLLQPVNARQADNSKNNKDAMDKYRKKLRECKNDLTIDLPDKPKLSHNYISDITIESLADIYNDDSRGVLSFQDELSGFMLGMNQYKVKGNDAQHYISLFYGKPWKVDRKNESKFIPNTGLALVGGIQPKFVPWIFEDAEIDNGLFPRFITENIGGSPGELDLSCMDESVMDEWGNLINSCYSLPIVLDEHGFVKPQLLIMQRDGAEKWLKFHNEWATLIPYMSDRLAPFVEKYKGYYSLKFAGILHALKSFINGTPLTDPISIETINNAIELTRYYAGQAMLTLNLYDESKRLTEFQARLIRVFYHLRDEVKNGQLLFSRIVQVFNDGLPEMLQHTHQKLTGMVGDFKLKTIHGSQNVVYLVWESERLESLFSQIPLTLLTLLTRKHEKGTDRVNTVNTVNREPKEQDSEIYDSEGESVEVEN